MADHACPVATVINNDEDDNEAVASVYPSLYQVRLRRRSVGKLNFNAVSVSDSGSSGVRLDIHAIV